MLTSALCASVHHVCHHLWHHFWWLLSYADICCLSPFATGLAVGVQHIQFKCHSECGSDNDSHNGRTGQSCQHASSLQGCSQQIVTAYSFVVNQVLVIQTLPCCVESHAAASLHGKLENQCKDKWQHMGSMRPIDSKVCCVLSAMRRLASCRYGYQTNFKERLLVMSTDEKA